MKKHAIVVPDKCVRIELKLVSVQLFMLELQIMHADKTTQWENNRKATSSGSICIDSVLALGWSFSASYFPLFTNKPPPSARV